MDNLHLTRDCQATIIPAGETLLLEKGTAFSIKQALGSTVTIQTQVGLFRIENKDLDALGEVAQTSTNIDAPALDADSPLTEEHIWAQLKQCFDPEIPVNIVDLGLIYDLKITPSDKENTHTVDVKMTLTAQGCGMGPAIAADAKEKIEQLSQVETANVEIVWDPVWTPHMISEEARKTLGL